MKIIKKGKVPEEEERYKKCRKCGCIFTYLWSDVKAFDLDCILYINCPTCDSSLDISMFDRKVKRRGNYEQKEIKEGTQDIK